MKIACAEKEDNLRRMAYITAFSIAQYQACELRNLKPFNPILGETFELFTQDYKFLCEQVSHHPPISAFHFENTEIESWGHTNVKNYFWGGSLEFKAIGLQHFFMKDKKHHYIMQRPDNSANNLLMTIYLDVHGKSFLHNLDTDEYVDITYFRRNWTGTANFKVEAFCKQGKDGEPKYKITGHWNNELRLTNLETGEEELMWSAHPKIENSERQFNFGQFVIHLNNLTEQMKEILPPTDTRFRMDQRLFEEGQVKEAGAEKHRLEEKQRAARKLREELREEWAPKWFDEIQDECVEPGVDGLAAKTWKIKTDDSGYWKKRQEQDWSVCPELF